MAIVRLATARWVGIAIGRVFRDCIPSRGLRIATSSPAVSPRVKALLFWRLYESAEMRFLATRLRTDLDVIELGSSIGVGTALIAKRLAPGRRVLCVEANPDLIPLLNRNLELNGVAERCTVVQGAVATSEEATVVFRRSESDHGRVVSDGEARDSVVVTAVRFGDLVRASGFDRFALVADIEGSEVPLVYEETDTLERCEQVVIELHRSVYRGKEVSVSDLRDAWAELGFDARAADGPVVVFERPFLDPGATP